MTKTTVDYVNIGLIVFSLLLAVYIPFEVSVNGKPEIGCTLKVDNGLITGYVILIVEGVVGNVKVTLATNALRETYENISTAADLQNKMSGISGISGIGEIELKQFSSFPLLASPLKTHIREAHQFTNEQVDVFTMAFYGDYTKKPDWVALNLAPERRIVLSGWTVEYSKWLAIHKDIKDVFLDILFVHPLGLVMDFPRFEEDIAPELLQAKPMTKTNAISEDAMQRMVDIIREDDVVTPDFVSMMQRVKTYVNSVIGKQTSIPQKATAADVIAKSRADTLFGRKEGSNISLFELPPFWSLQRVSLKKFGTADYWRNIADLNHIANPLDEVEMFEGRKLALPKSASDKVK